jgi:hypothetical protein
MIYHDDFLYNISQNSRVVTKILKDQIKKDSEGPN